MWSKFGVKLAIKPMVKPMVKAKWYDNRADHSPRVQVARAHLRALPQQVVCVQVPVCTAHLCQALQAPAQVPRLIVGYPCKVLIERRRQAEVREACDGVPCEVDCIELRRHEGQQATGDTKT